MTIQNYLMVNESTNVVDNICLWDGDNNTWQPPQGYLMLIQADILASIWQFNSTNKTWSLKEVMGAGEVGFTWNGTILITNQPQPIPPTPAEIQPNTSGTQTI